MNTRCEERKGKKGRSSRGLDRVISGMRLPWASQQPNVATTRSWTRSVESLGVFCVSLGSEMNSQQQTACYSRRRWQTQVRRGRKALGATGVEGISVMASRSSVCGWVVCVCVLSQTGRDLNHAGALTLPKNRNAPKHTGPAASVGYL